MNQDNSHHEVVINVEKLVKCYSKNIPVLNNIDLQIFAGEMFALLGPNGAGKTTLFSILSTLSKPTSGKVEVSGYDVLQNQVAVRKNIGIVFQEPALAHTLTVSDNLTLMARFYGLSGSCARERINMLLDTLGLLDVSKVPVQKLSGGQRRRLELARSIVSDPKIIFLDEATLGLDVHARNLFWSQMRRLTKQGKTVFFTSHYLEEADVADRIALIDKGNIVALDTPLALKALVGKSVIKIITVDNINTHDWLIKRGYQSKIEENGLTIIVNQDDSAIDMIKSLYEAPAKILHLELNKLSLEDVFLQLTRGSSISKKM